jgi:predicted DNA-binding transcriptional regulator AlpA
VKRALEVCADGGCPFVRVREVAAMTLLSEREVWRRARSDASFPKPRKVSARVTVWVRREVERWQERVIGSAA